MNDLEWHSADELPRERVMLLIKVAGRRKLIPGFYSCGQWIELSIDAEFWELPLRSENLALLWTYMPEV